MSIFSTHEVLRSLLIISVLVLTTGGRLSAANKAKIDEAIQKAQSYITSQRLSGPAGALGLYAYIKSGGNKKIDAVKLMVTDVQGKFQSGSYRPTAHHNYEAGVDLMFLEAVDPEEYRPQLEAIVTYLLSTQQPNGAWFYDRQIETDCCDTSITQYALLGLWAAVRAGVDVPVEALERVARWQMGRQREDGGFAYHPFDRKLFIDPEAQRSSATMTVAGSSNLLIIRKVLFNDETEMDAEVRPPEAKRRFGILERFTEEKTLQKPKDPGTVTLRPGPIDRTLKDSMKSVASHYIDKSSRTEMYFYYYLYSIERVAALMDVERLGNSDWYDEGANELLKRQAADGSWTDHCGAVPSTAFGLMFLSKATTTIVTPKRKKAALMGGGLQVGGRGLPDNLDAVKVKDGNVTARKIADPVDSLLIELEKSSDAKVEDVQAAVVDAVQLDQPEKMIGQIERLRKLATDSRLEVRRTALWALGRSGDVSCAPVLYDALLDPDISVMREASLGLCILTRRPEGIGKPIDPTEDVQMGLKEDATDDERKTVLEKWKKESRERWFQWYLKNRPYDEKDDKWTLRPAKK